MSHKPQIYKWDLDILHTCTAAYPLHAPSATKGYAAVHVWGERNKQVWGMARSAPDLHSACLFRASVV